MKNIFRALSAVLLLVLIISAFSACVGENPDNGSSGTAGDSAGSSSVSGTESNGSVTDSTVTNNTSTGTPVTEAPGPVAEIDFAASVRLDMNSETAKQKIDVSTFNERTFVDGDTSHFRVPTTVSESGTLKARYIAINTRESTGKIEEYGKTASNFTKAKLQSATSVVVESDDANWNIDSTGGRYLVWVWYRTSESDEYRNLNIEILQNGLAVASSSANNRYGQTCVAALAQAKLFKHNIFSGKQEEGFYYGAAIELTLKELRCNIKDYDGKKVAFEGVITLNNNNSVYIEEYDAETDMYYGISIYYGFGLSGDGLEILSVGNRSRIVGTVQYYAAGGTYQVSGLTYRSMRPNDPENIQKISENNLPAFKNIDAGTFLDGKVTVTSEEDVKKEYSFAELAMNTTVSMDGLYVKSVYTTSNPDSSSNGAMTLTCETQDGKKITVRTDVLIGSDGNIITADAYKGKTVSVKGIIDYYDGAYQIKVFSKDHITTNQ